MTTDATAEPGGEPVPAAASATGAPAEPVAVSEPASATEASAATAPAASTDPPELVAPAVSSSDLVGPGPDYKIRPGDLLEFQSLDDVSLSRLQLVVRPDGFISLPFIPDIQVAGHTRTEATEMVRAAYTSIYKEPQISLAVVEAVSNTYYVLGEVQAPNEYPYTRPISVLSAITKAGGLRVASQSGNQSYLSRQGQLVKAFIIRQTADERQVYSVDLRQLTRSGPHPSQTPVLPGDIVFVPEGLNLVYLLGEVGRSDVFQLREGMTMLQLMAAASGPRFSSARLREVALMREIDAQHTRVLLLDVKQMLKTGRDFVLMPGDIIYVPRKRLTIAQEFVGRFTGTVSPVMSLYQQAWDTYYTDQRYDAIFDTPGGTNNVLGVLQGLRDFSSLIPSTTAVK